MRSFKLAIFLSLFAVVIFLAAADFAAAQGLISGKIFQETGIANWIKAVYLFGMGIIGVLAVAVIVFAGIQYTTSVGNPEVIQQAKAKIAAAIAGLLLILLSYTILHTLDPRLTKIGFEMGEKLELKGKSWKDWGKNLLLKPSPGTTTTKIQAENRDEAEYECQMSCPGGDIKVNDLFDCVCAGGGQKISCEKDEDCEKECESIYSKDECDTLVMYCQKDKTCGKRDEAGEQDVGGKCGSNKECKTGVCKEKECIPPKKEYEACKEDIECESEVCGSRRGPKTCGPIGGEPPGEKCYNKDKACASQKCNTKTNECTPHGRLEGLEVCDLGSVCKSGICIDEKALFTDNKCMRVGGNLYDELCEINEHCKPGSRLLCYDNDYCICPGKEKWDKTQEKCVSK